MSKTNLEPCPGCTVLLPPSDGSTHRYIGASPACWAVYSALSVGEPAVASGPYNGLLVDAYAAQHPGFSFAPGHSVGGGTPADALRRVGKRHGSRPGIVGFVCGHCAMANNQSTAAFIG